MILGIGYSREDNVIDFSDGERVSRRTAFLGQMEGFARSGKQLRQVCLYLWIPAAFFLPFLRRPREAKYLLKVWASHGVSAGIGALVGTWMQWAAEAEIQSVVDAVLADSRERLERMREDGQPCAPARAEAIARIWGLQLPEVRGRRELRELVIATLTRGHDSTSTAHDEPD